MSKPQPFSLYSWLSSKSEQALRVSQFSGAVSEFFSFNTRKSSAGTENVSETPRICLRGLRSRVEPSL